MDFAELFIDRRHGLDKGRFVHFTDNHPLFFERCQLLGFVIPDEFAFIGSRFQGGIQ